MEVNSVKVRIIPQDNEAKQIQLRYITNKSRKISYQTTHMDIAEFYIPKNYELSEFPVRCFQIQ